MEIKSKVGEFILWKPNAETTSFWWDNWSALGAIPKFWLPGPKSGEIEFNNFIEDDRWQVDELKEKLPAHILKQVVATKIGTA